MSMPDLERLLAAATDLDTKADEQPSVEELLARNAELEATVLALQDDSEVADYEAGGDVGVPLAGPVREPGDDGTDDLAAPGADDYDD